MRDFGLYEQKEIVLKGDIIKSKKIYRLCWLILISEY